MRTIDYDADILVQLQDACDLATEPRELERLCGNARIEIIKLRKQRAELLFEEEWDEPEWDEPEGTEPEGTEPWYVDTIDNYGDYGDGPDCHSGFKSFAIYDNDGNVLFDSLNRSHQVSEIAEEISSDELGDGVYVWDRLAEADARRIVACVNACKTIPTDMLELVGQIVTEGAIPHRILTMQRDVLRTALMAIAKLTAGPHVNHKLSEIEGIALDAIARAEQGA